MDRPCFVIYLYCDTRKVTVYINKLPRYVRGDNMFDRRRGDYWWYTDNKDPENDCKLDYAHLVIKNKDVRHLRFTQKYRGSQIRLITGEETVGIWLLKNKPFSQVLKTQSDSRLLVSNCLSLFKIKSITNYSQTKSFYIYNEHLILRLIARGITVKNPTAMPLLIAIMHG